MSRHVLIRFPVFLAVLFASTTAALAEEQTYSREEIRSEVEGFFEGTTEGLAEIIEKVFRDHGPPNGFIKGG